MWRVCDLVCYLVVECLKSFEYCAYACLNGAAELFGTEFIEWSSTNSCCVVWAHLCVELVIILASTISTISTLRLPSATEWFDVCQLVEDCYHSDGAIRIPIDGAILITVTVLFWLHSDGDILIHIDGAILITVTVLFLTHSDNSLSLCARVPCNILWILSVF